MTIIALGKQLTLNFDTETIVSKIRKYEEDALNILQSCKYSSIANEFKRFIFSK